MICVKFPPFATNTKLLLPGQTPSPLLSLQTSPIWTISPWKTPTREFTIVQGKEKIARGDNCLEGGQGEGGGVDILEPLHMLHKSSKELC